MESKDLIYRFTEAKNRDALRNGFSYIVQFRDNAMGTRHAAAAKWIERKSSPTGGYLEYLRPCLLVDGQTPQLHGESEKYTILGYADVAHGWDDGEEEGAF